jgi:hypothetical protein
VKDASEYLVYIRSVILLDEQVQHWQIMREEAQGHMGLLRYRLFLQNGDLLDLFERFTIEQEQILVTRYSYHWQRANQQFIKRWDNAPHYPAIATYPHHLHDGDENNVLPHPSITLMDVLTFIRQINS